MHRARARRIPNPSQPRPSYDDYESRDHLYYQLLSVCSSTYVQPILGRGSIEFAFIWYTIM